MAAASHFTNDRCFQIADKFASPAGLFHVFQVGMSQSSIFRPQSQSFNIGYLPIAIPSQIQYIFLLNVDYVSDSLKWQQ